jgi:phosphoenolpyruvate synthase/pyruvate phosphate dikinase
VPASLGDDLDPGRFGHKAANLSTAARAGLPVPAGFALDTATLETIVERGDVGAVQEALDALARDAVAVRSSAVGEDAPGASFAGQHVTTLNVRGAAAVLEALAAVHASARSPSAEAYRARAGGAGDGRTGAVIQEFVASDSAGVLFTRDPLGVRDDVFVAEAAVGLGEAVVAGLVTPHRYVIAADGSLLDYERGGDEAVVRAKAGGGTTTEAPRERAEPLPPDAVAELAALGRACDDLFGRGQDLEWGWAGGSVVLYQCRPITHLAPPA